MGHYENGKIYLLKNHKDKDKVYVGSTTRELHERFLEHKSRHKSFDKTKKQANLYKNIECWNDWYIELYEEYSCKTKRELEEREKEVILEHGTLNTCIPTRSDEEYRIFNKQKKREYDLEYRKEREKESIICECGGKYKPRHKSTHLNTNTHLNHLKMST